MVQVKEEEREVKEADRETVHIKQEEIKADMSFVATYILYY